MYTQFESIFVLCQLRLTQLKFI